MSKQEPTDNEKFHTNLETLIGGVAVVGVLMFFPAVGSWLHSFSSGVTDFIFGLLGVSR